MKVELRIGKEKDESLKPMLGGIEAEMQVVRHTTNIQIARKGFCSVLYNTPSGKVSREADWRDSRKVMP